MDPLQLSTRLMARFLAMSWGLSNKVNIRPELDSALEREFTAAMNTTRLRLNRIIIAVLGCFTLAVLLTYFFQEDGTRGGLLWSALVLLPGFGSSCVVSLVISSICACRKFQPFVIQNAEFLTIVWLNSAFLGYLWSDTMKEKRRAMFGHRIDTTTREVIQNLNYTFQESALRLPRIECTDSQIVSTLQTWSTAEEPGCTFGIINGASALMFVCAFTCMSTFQMSSKFAIRKLAMDMTGCVAIILFTGHHGPIIWLTLVLMAFAGSVDVVQCRLIREAERTAFVTKRTHIYTANQHRRLLHTLIPPTVLERMSYANNYGTMRFHNISTGAAGDESLLCMQLPEVSMLFCSFHFNVVSTDDFDYISSLLVALDAVVYHSGMFKYQYVAQGSQHVYIVTCPRVAEPFNTELQHAQYPPEWCEKLIKVGFELVNVCTIFKKPDGTELSMKIGINSGPVAGGVIGKCRRFYCLFGNNVNTASRMCSNAQGSNMCISHAFYVLSSAARQRHGLSHLDFSSRGMVNIKGIGPMHLYDVCNQSYSIGAVQAQCNTTASCMSSQPAVSAEEIHEVESWHQGIRDERHDSPRSMGLESRTLIQKSSVDPTQNIPAAEFKLSMLWSRFENPDLEAQFMQVQVQNDRISLTAGYFLHTILVLWQLLAIVSPSATGYFKGHSNADLETRIKMVSMVLLVHLLMTILVSVVCLFILWRGLLLDRYCQPMCWLLQHRAVYSVRGRGRLEEGESSVTVKSTQSCSRGELQFCVLGYCLLKILNLVMAVVGLRIWPSQICTFFVFATGMMFNFGFSHSNYGVSFRINLVLVICCVVFICIFYLAEGHSAITSNIWMLCQATGSLCVSVIVSRERRITWSRYAHHHRQLEVLVDILSDLIPSKFAMNLMNGCGVMTQPSSVCSIVALQLDIAGFTTLSQTVSPDKLASVLNLIFSDFDEFVVKVDLFKVDTVGDAYLVVGFLDHDPLASTSFEPSSGAFSAMSAVSTDANNAETRAKRNGKRCMEMLELAQVMIASLETHRQATGIPFHARIGIATGTAIAGMLGELQPRFSLQGQAMHLAAELETNGKTGAVHCSADFVNTVSKCEQGVKALATWHNDRPLMAEEIQMNSTNSSRSIHIHQPSPLSCVLRPTSVRNYVV